MSDVELRTGFLPVGIDHQMYFEDIGDITKEPLLFIHGGPGTGTEEKHRTQFDLSKYRVILYDQRGCGRSQNLGELNENSTELLIRDIDALRRRLRISKWTVLGSSWGAVLACGYAAQFPERVQGLILKSPFLARRKDFLWSYTAEGVAKLLPEEWQHFSLNYLQNDTLVTFYYRSVLHEKDIKKHKDLLCRWINWGSAQYHTHRPHEHVPVTPETLTQRWTDTARLQIYYAKNNFFMPPTGILPWIEMIAKSGIKGICIQGEKDTVTPTEETQELKKLWPELDLRIIPEADHKIPAEVLMGL